MKNVMRTRSSTLVQGLGSFSFTGAPTVEQQMLLPGIGPLHELCDELARKFAGQTIVFTQLLTADNHPTAAESNYRDAILQLEIDGIVTVVVPGRERRKLNNKLSLPNDAVITFRPNGD